MPRLSKQNQTRTPKTGQPGRSPLTKYYRSETPAGSNSPFVKRTPKRSIRKFLFGFLDTILITVLLFGIGYSLMLQPRAKIISNDYSFHPKSSYQEAADQLLGQIKNRNKITFSEKSLVSSLQQQFPEIAGVQVELPFFSEKPTLRLSISKPSFQLNSKGQSYIVNSNGVAVAPISQLPNITGLAVVDDQSDFNVQPGSRVLSSNSVNFINSLIEQCQSAKVPIASLTLPPLPQEVHLRTKDQAYYVKFYLGGDVLQETGQFLAARKHFAQTNQYPSQYLDVRIAGKIFYK